MPKKAEERTDGVEQVREIPLEKIVPNPHQPRERFDEAALQELANSIREKGLLQPVVVRLLDGEAGKYELVVGERRLRACELLERPTIQAVIREISAEESREIALIENLQRDDLTVMEEARSLNALVEQYEGNRSAVAAKIAKSVNYVSDRVDLLKLPRDIQKLVEEGKINVAQAKVILELDSEKAKRDAAKLAVKLNLSANELKGRMQRHLKKSGEGKARAGVVTYTQLSSVLVRLYDALDVFEYSMLGDQNKRVTLKRQLELVQKATTAALERLGQTNVQKETAS